MHLSLFQTVSHADRVQGFLQSAASTGWIRSSRITSSSKTRLKALDISSLEFYPYSVVAYIHQSLSTYLTMAVVVPKPNCQLPINCTSVNKLIMCRCQQPSCVAVNKHHLSLSTNCSTAAGSKTNTTQTNHLSKNDLDETKKCFKGNYKPTMYFVLSFAYHSTVLCQQSNANFFNKI